MTDTFSDALRETFRPISTEYIGRRGAAAHCWYAGADDRWKFESVAGRTFVGRGACGDGWTTMIELGVPGSLCKVCVRTDDFDKIFSEARS